MSKDRFTELECAKFILLDYKKEVDRLKSIVEKNKKITMSGDKLTELECTKIILQDYKKENNRLESVIEKNKKETEELKEQIRNIAYQLLKF